MALPSNVVKEFASAVNNSDTNSKTTTTYFGTVQTVNGTTGATVKLDGSDIDTPVTLGIVVSAGDRVVVTVADHSAQVTTNLSNIANNKANAAIVADTLSVKDLNALNATIGGFVIGAWALYNPSTKMGLGLDSIAGVYVGIDGLEVSGGTDSSGNQLGYFKATNSGDIEVHNITMNGDIKGESEGGQIFFNNSSGSSVWVSDDAGISGSTGLGLTAIKGSVNISSTASSINLGSPMVITNAGYTQWAGGYGANGMTINPDGKLVATNAYIGTLNGSSGYITSLSTATGTVSKSDRTIKKDIVNVSDQYLSFFDKLNPVTFRFTDYDRKTHDRVHVGFISQDVEQALIDLGLTDLDFGGFCKDAKLDDSGNEIKDADGNIQYDYSLRYQEFIGLLAAKIKQLETRITELEGSNAK